jgi:hypothetical protein
MSRHRRPQHSNAQPAPDQAKWPSHDISENRHRSATFKNHACMRCRTRIRTEAVFSLKLGAAQLQQIPGVPGGRHGLRSERNQQTPVATENQPDVDSLSIASRPSYDQLGVYAGPAEPVSTAAWCKVAGPTSARYRERFGALSVPQESLFIRLPRFSLARVDGGGRCLGAQTNQIQQQRGQFWRDDSGTHAMATIPNPVSPLAPELFRMLSFVWPAFRAGWRRRICVSASAGRGSRSRRSKWLEAPRVPAA